MFKIMQSSVAAALAIFLIYPTQASADSSKYAQAAPQQKASPASPSPSEPSPNFTGQIDQLQRLLDERRKRLDQLSEDIKKGLQTEEQANEIFNQLARSFKELNDKIGPDSEYRKSLDEILRRARQREQQYSADKDSAVRETAKSFGETAQKAEKLINETNTEYARGVETLRHLEEGRALTIARIQAGALRSAADAAGEYLDVVRKAINDMDAFNKKNREPATGF